MTGNAGREKWMEASVWADRMVSALANGVAGGKWYSLIDKVYRPSTLQAAWERVARNKGAAGVDGQGVAKFAHGADRYLMELGEALRTGSYRPQPVRRVEIPKGDGKTRPLGIPTVKDRVVQAALRMVLEPIFETQFRPGSFGFRPGRGCKDGLREVDRLLKEGYAHVVDADLKSYFDTIPHVRLMERVEAHLGDGHVLTLVRSFLEQDIVKEMERLPARSRSFASAKAGWQPTAGTPRRAEGALFARRAVISPLLANLYLHPLDLLMEERGHRVVRYADDFVILCQTAEEAVEALGLVKAWVAENGLTLHPEKTLPFASRDGWLSGACH